jgi:uncharacterized protein YcgI (DUF1989 family)
MLLQHLNLGAALLLVGVIAACSSGDSSKIMAQTPVATAKWLVRITR